MNSETRKAALRGAGALACMMMLGSCGGGLLDSLKRSADDPVVVSPRVKSFAKSLSIEVTWSADAGAEEYVLERASDAADPVYATVYRGAGLAYGDEPCADQDRYLYRLWKVRGSEVFGPSEAVMGFSSAVTEDEFEPNDTKGAATVLTFTCNANLPYFQSDGGATSTDPDWYAVDVPGRMRACVQIHQASPAPSSVGGELLTRLRYSIDEYLVDRAKQDCDILLENNGVTAKRMYIQLYTRASEALDAPGAGGGIVIAYAIKLIRIEAL